MNACRFLLIVGVGAAVFAPLRGADKKGEELAKLCAQVIDADEAKARQAALKLTDAHPEVAKHVITLRFGASRDRRLQACYLLPRVKPTPVGAESVLVWYARTTPTTSMTFRGDATAAALIAAAEINPHNKEVVELIRKMVNYHHKERAITLRVQKGALTAYHRVLDKNAEARPPALDLLKGKAQEKPILKEVVVALGECGPDARLTLRGLLVHPSADIRRLADLQLKMIDRKK